MSLTPEQRDERSRQGRRANQDSRSSLLASSATSPTSRPASETSSVSFSADHVPEAGLGVSKSSTQATRLNTYQLQPAAA